VTSSGRLRRRLAGFRRLFDIGSGLLRNCRQCSAAQDLGASDGFHNESLAILDSVVSAAVEEPPLNDPPAAPAVGSSYLVGDAPTGDWSGKAQSLATFTSGGWRFVAAGDGQTAYVRSTGARALYRDGSWQTASAISSPTGGTTVDAEARAAVEQILSALRLQGVIEG
jgi:Protein of unknown function (DUF2793)